MASPRGALVEIRREIRETAAPYRRRCFLHRVARATRERVSPEEKRTWPRRKPLQTPQAPHILPAPWSKKPCGMQL